MAVVAIPFILSACASLNEEQCRGADWKVIGFNDGLAGQPLSRLDDHRKACAKYGILPDDKLWLATREQGLKRYCTPINGLQQGRNGSGYPGTCPPETAAGFLSAYWVGQAVATARTRVSNLEGQLYALQNRIANTAPGKERDQLVRDEARLGGRWGGELYRTRQDLAQAEGRADELAQRLHEAAGAVPKDGLR